MGLLSFLYAQRSTGGKSLPEGAIFLGGNNAYDVRVVGESEYQESLSKIAGGRNEYGVHHKCFALLAPDDSNPHEPNTVRIVIDGRTVGYFPAPTSGELRKALSSLGAEGKPVYCRAKIVGGWDRGNGDIGYFGVKLNLVWPVKPRTPPA
jgi:hypothetical protein